MSNNLSTKTTLFLNRVLILWVVGFFLASGVIIATLAGPESYAASGDKRGNGVAQIGLAGPLGHTAHAADRWQPQHPSGRVVPCLLEDGSGVDQTLPCYWDAKVRGNKRGDSFWIDSDESLHYFKPKVDFLYQHRLEGFKRYLGIYKGHKTCVTTPGSGSHIFCQDGLRERLPKHLRS